MKQDSLVAPALKWVGGKRQLLKDIEPMVPKEYSTYYEPFVGGGAVLFALQPAKAVINDANEELINVYITIRDQCEELINELKLHEQNNKSEYYYEVRGYDRNQEKYTGMSRVERAARILYLNKTCYNGLFRVNQSGQFNSPYGKYKNPNIVNETTLRALHRFLNRKGIRILSGDYKEALKTAKKGAFVYLDPPYHPISYSSSFTGYTNNGFGMNQQIELKEICDKLNKRGVNFLLSNSYCDFILELYQNFTIKQVSAKRAINSNASKRGDVEEVLISNYEI
ncbi:DNA adenine methylase [Anaeromicropila populeti]|uniref:Site-specific DNA-methyltransferase (adenine-specific) n=1 Tax=Anaeromicropila populeti TaxID=37658 RepID=A0A1I6LBF6_9FIRM|nr:DNA adenine methylase [Anaeromicropila populeti]SFS00803.1 DNA adenine methylase [Anaeromicropila populeti]